ncbi:Uncharacterised protein [Actinomyces viscosus]|uniref:Uncharacterized protein n=1 Tax=Actinomyces viscosus TaxID=1656 RepID=A0A3S4XA37_ACTVI|nr:Uncharacterised protein [Actinomyces viscosus]
MSPFRKLSFSSGGELATRDCGRLDRSRGVVAFTALVAGILMVFLSFIPNSSIALQAWLLLIGCSSIVYGVHGYVLYSRIDGADRYWRGGESCVKFVPPVIVEVAEVLVNAMMTVSSLVSLCLALLSGMDIPGDRRALSFSLLMTAASILAWTAVPIYVPGSPAIELRPGGMTIWPLGIGRRYVPWDSCPVVVGSKKVAGVQRAVIAYETGATYVSITSIPLGCEQLRRVVAFYGAHPELRGELKQQRGLERVRELMYTTVDDIEEELKNGSARTVSE